MWWTILLRILLSAPPVQERVRSRKVRSRWITGRLQARLLRHRRPEWHRRRTTRIQSPAYRHRMVPAWHSQPCCRQRSAPDRLQQWQNNSRQRRFPELHTSMRIWRNPIRPQSGTTAYLSIRCALVPADSRWKSALYPIAGTDGS